MNTNDITIASYNSTFDIYAAANNTILGDFKTRIDSSLALIPKSGTILELGTGTGSDADYMEAHGYQVTRSDYADAFLDYNRSRGKEILKIDALHIPHDKTYDMVYANAVLLHFSADELTKIIGDIYKMLPSGGVLSCSFKK